MNFVTFKRLTSATLAIALTSVPALAAAQAVAPRLNGRPLPVLRAAIPLPQLAYLGQMKTPKDDKTLIFYRFEIKNRADYPAVLWAPTPGLPACGTTVAASRAWVDIFAADGTKLYTYCVVQDGQLAQFGFNLPEGAYGPSQVYVVITDRATGKTYKSNTVAIDAPQAPIIH